MLILNVDDDNEDSEMFCDAVHTIDPQISCIHAAGGFEAIEFLTTKRPLPDFIFIDINMPKMNGYECVREIKSYREFEQVQVVMYSTTFNPEDLNEFARLGVRYLVKPSKFNDLVQSIKRLIFYNELTQQEEKQ